MRIAWGGVVALVVVAVLLWLAGVRSTALMGLLVVAAVIIALVLVVHRLARR